MSVAHRTSPIPKYDGGSCDQSKVVKFAKIDDLVSDTIRVASPKAENGTQANITYKQKSIVPYCFRGLKQIRPSESPKIRKAKLMDWKKYHRLAVVYSFLDDLEKEFPSICTVSVIGTSVKGKPIKMIKISNSHATNVGVWIDGSIHSREWISTAVATYIADNLARNFDKLPKYFLNKDWYITPVLNPDGYEYTHTKDRMWRKNRAKYGNGVGVDLNRNFSFQWGNKEGSSTDPTHQFFRGPAPFSEPEAACVRDVILGSSTKFKVFLSFHSYYQSIIFPWGYKEEPCPDYISLLEGGVAMSTGIYNYSGKTYKVGTTKDLTYFACGTSIDWSYAVGKIPFSYMIELRNKKYRFCLPKDQILDTCIENWMGISNLMEYIHNAKPPVKRHR